MGTVVVGTLNSAPDATFTLQFFDPSNNTSAFSADVTVTKVTTTTAVQPALAAPAAAPVAPAKTTALVLETLPAASSTQDDSVLTALAVDQVHAKKDREASRSSHRLEHAVRIRMSHPRPATIRIHTRPVAITKPTKTQETGTKTF